MNIRTIIYFALLTTPWSAFANTGCPIQFAHYKYGWEGGVADFIMTRPAAGLRSKLSLHLFFKGVGEAWFLFDQGNARYVSLISTEDVNSPTWTAPDPDSNRRRPLADQKYLAWNDDMRISNDPPVKGSMAPEYFVIPELPEALQFDQGKPEIIGAGIYKFDFCKR